MYVCGSHKSSPIFDGFISEHRYFFGLAVIPPLSRLPACRAFLILVLEVSVISTLIDSRGGGLARKDLVAEKQLTCTPSKSDPLVIQRIRVG